MKAMVLAGLQRKLLMYQSAGMTEKAERTAHRIAQLEAMPEPDTSEPDGAIGESWSHGDPDAGKVEIVTYEAAAPAGVEMTPAAQARASELGLTPEDFTGYEPSGRGGLFLVGDVERIAEARDHLLED